MSADKANIMRKHDPRRCPVPQRAFSSPRKSQSAAAPAAPRVPEEHPRLTRIQIPKAAVRRSFGRCEASARRGGGAKSSRLQKPRPRICAAFPSTAHRARYRTSPDKPTTRCSKYAPIRATELLMRSCGAQVARGAPQGRRAAQSTNGEMASPAAVCHRCGGIAARVLIPGRTFLPPTIPDEAMASASDETRRTRRSAAGDMTRSTRGGGQEQGPHPGIPRPPLRFQRQRRCAT